MLSKKRVTFSKLISYILTFTSNNVNENILDNVFASQLKSNDEFKFVNLKVGETKNINDFPEKLKSLFDPFIKNLNRCSSKKNLGNDINLTLYFSILKLLIKEFEILSTTDQMNYITKLRDKLVIFISNDETLKLYEYDKLGWTKKNIMNSLAQFKSNKIILKIIADFFNLNIFVLNITEDKIYVMSEKDYYDLFRLNMFLVFNNDVFEPLIYDNNNLLDYNSSLMKKLITVDKNFINLMEINIKDNVALTFNVKLDNIVRYQKEEIIISNKIDIVANNKNSLENKINSNINNEEVEMVNGYGEIIPTESDANTYIEDIEKSNNSNPKSSQLVFKISSKMKLDELQSIAKKLNISLEKEPDSTKKYKKNTKTKGELIEEINKILNNEKLNL